MACIHSVEEGGALVTFCIPSLSRCEFCDALPCPCFRVFLGSFMYVCLTLVCEHRPLDATQFSSVKGSG